MFVFGAICCCCYTLLREAGLFELTNTSDTSSKIHLWFLFHVCMSIMEFNALNGTSFCNHGNSNLKFDLSDPVIADQWVATDTATVLCSCYHSGCFGSWDLGVFGNAAFMFMIFRLSFRFPELRI